MYGLFLFEEDVRIIGGGEGVPMLCMAVVVYDYRPFGTKHVRFSPTR